MSTHSPLCGHPFSPVDVVLSDLHTGYQCHHCWNRIHATGAGTTPFRIRSEKKPRVLRTRHKAETREKKP